MSEWIYRERDTCRSCRSSTLKKVLNLGSLHFSSFPEPAEPDTPKVPLDVIRCSSCGLVQLRHTTNPDLLYRTYWYRSGTNQTMRRALADICHSVERIMRLKKDDVVVDLGCNDGTLLSSYSVPGLRSIGFEPATNVAAVAREVPGLHVINDYFHSKAAMFEELKGKAQVVTTIAMFYDLDDPHTFIEDVDSILAEDGLWVIQIAYLPSMLERNAFDAICHEHLAYYHLSSIEHLLGRHGFEIREAELVDLNEGSIRLYIRRARDAPIPDFEADKKKVRAIEAHLHLDSQSPYERFGSRVESIKGKTNTVVREAFKSGRSVHAYGASTKGNTLLQYFGLDAGLVQYAWERQESKWGRETVGTRIPIISEEEGRKMKPDYLLMLPWHFATEFTNRESAYLAGGGKFIIPLPEFRVT